MARARNIKPGFFKNELLAECSPWGRLCFAGLWTLADREGRLEDRPKRIKAELFPFDSVETEPLLSELERHGFLVRYRNSDGSFIQIAKFLEHQSPHYSEKHSVIKPIGFQESTHGDEDIKLGDLPENSKNSPVIKEGSQPPDSLIADSLIADSFKKIGRESGGKKTPKPDKTPLPNDFSISQAVRSWASEKGHAQLEARLEDFIGRAKANGYAYVDWDQAFMNSIRNDWAKLDQQKTNGAKNGYVNERDASRAEALEILTGRKAGATHETC